MKLTIASLIVVATVLISGCKTTPPVVTTKTPVLSATGAVIVKQDAKYFYYKKKCEACGFTSKNQIGSGYPKGKGKLSSTFKCPKCGKNQKVQIEIKEASTTN
ncbi:MAG: hypothetical protein KAS46_07120 [Candidatus Aureabacteria bacterium]|nr:hypothetical protein [Candidatus Auribacterota bacterium]